MKKILVLFIATFSQFIVAQEVDYVKLSTEFIEAVKNKTNKVPSIITALEKADEKELIKQLDNDEKKKTFFINVYNAFTNNALTKNPEQYKDRNKFFKSEQFTIAGYKLSLDIIEHGFLRKSSVKLSLGKLKKSDMGVFQITGKNSNEDYKRHS